jgi:hypothetical protein
VRPPWDGVGERTRFPIAWSGYTRATGLWAISWRDRNLKLQEYPRKRRAQNVQSLLDHIETGDDRSSGAGGRGVDYRYSGG